MFSSFLNKQCQFSRGYSVAGLVRKREDVRCTVFVAGLIWLNIGCLSHVKYLPIVVSICLEIIHVAAL